MKILAPFKMCSKTGLISRVNRCLGSGKLHFHFHFRFVSARRVGLIDARARACVSAWTNDRVDGARGDCVFVRVVALRVFAFHFISIHRLIDF